MTHNHTKTNLKARDGAHNRNEPHKRGLLLRFIIFMAWVIGIGLLLSLVACQPVNIHWLFLCLIIAQPLKLSLYNLAQPHKRTHAPQGGKPSYLR